jgi:hypothetical protein
LARLTKHILASCCQPAPRRASATPISMDDDCCQLGAKAGASSVESKATALCNYRRAMDSATNVMRSEGA